MDKIYLNDLKIDTIIGVYDWERHTRQTLRFDFIFDWDIRPAAQQDDLQHTLDYGLVAEKVVAFVENSEFQLIETLAEQVAQLLLNHFPITRLQLTLTKPVRLHGQNQAKIEIVRSR
ncbi:Dihydroneopterin aldolase [Methylophaga frappieri]|uniref:7,8-dihydroneopterin aldolase n=1 Tax=Methylophaga frappieri (strain ATCC BAA-2434 / DSM 25690 / JAM7) TaxID=754477 RepID=I1YJR3_METFJ|nr:dihydroneopterin aldolase [Methylophaga frappieri]AFJ03156.1 Dihydroneopterin aldolase [Methylophaga frappieri]